MDLSGDVKLFTQPAAISGVSGSLSPLEPTRVPSGLRARPNSAGMAWAYCATCDGEFFTRQGGLCGGRRFAAAEESVFLTKYARHVTILVREPDFTCAKSVADAARAHEKITVLTNTVVEEAAGDSMLRSLRYRNTETGEITEYRPPAGGNLWDFRLCGIPAGHGAGAGGWWSWTHRGMW